VNSYRPQSDDVDGQSEIRVSVVRTLFETCTAKLIDLAAS
jgi:hypothetical protein